jgi:cold shock CspA family protein
MATNSLPPSQLAERRSGRVKWFSQEQGRGYLIDEDGVERYFRVDHVRGYDLPQRGATVEFQPSNNSRGPTATHVVLIARPAEQAARDDGRVHCHHCHSRVVPRLVVYRGVAQRSLCTRCSGQLEDFTMGYAVYLGLSLLMLQAADWVRAVWRAVRRLLSGG